MPTSLYALLFVLGAIADSLWLAFRFPSLGPKNLTTAGVVFLTGGALLTLVGPLAGLASQIELREVGFLAAFAVGFAGFVYFFVTGLWLVRVMVGMLSGFMR